MPQTFLAVLLLLQAPQEEPFAADRPLRLRLSGEADLYRLHRDGALNEAGARLDALPPDGASTESCAGRVALRLDAELDGAASGVIELENREYDERINRGDPDRYGTDLKQAYLEGFGFLPSGLHFRIGIQDISFRNRPHDEPFFIDLGESEGFFGGLSESGDHGVLEATAVRVRYDLAEVFTVQALGGFYSEDGVDSDDETVFLAVLNGTPSEKLSAWVMGAHVTGPGSEFGGVWTLGAGVDAYVGKAKTLELFGEGYLQRGDFMDEPQRIRKRAFALNVGTRVVGLLDGHLWLEGAFSLRSGDKASGSGANEAFQSYENENRFLILQSSPFGLDVDTNVQEIRGAVGAGPFTVAGRPLRFQLDVGRFRADEPAWIGERDWGIETDLGARWKYSDGLRLWIKGAWLSSSDALGALSTEREEKAFLGVAGVDLRF